MQTSRSNYTGLDLALLRRRAGASQARMASVLGCTRQAVSNVEAKFRPSPSPIERYLDALERASK